MTEQKEVFEGFKNEINHQIIHFEKQTKDLVKHKKNLQISLISSLKDLELIRKQTTDLKRFSKDINRSLKEQIEEIKQLPFVKDVRLTTRSISVDVGRIEISHRDENFYIGDFTILITPEGIEVKNRNPIITKEGKLEHPHIHDGNVCFGAERGTKMFEYFAKFQLKQLVYMVYLFLKTYTERDKYYKISYWTQDAKRKERKQKLVK